MRTFTPLLHCWGTLHIPATAVRVCRGLQSRGRIKTNILSWCGKCINLLRCWAVNLACACIQRAVNFVNFVKTVFASRWPAARAAACYVNDMSIIRICIKIGSRRERRRAAAHRALCSARNIFTVFNLIPHRTCWNCRHPTNCQPFYQRSAFFLSLTDRSCPSSSLWKAGGGGHLIKSSETKLLRHLHPCARAQLSLTLASKENIFWVSLLSPRTATESWV